MIQFTSSEIKGHRDSQITHQSQIPFSICFPNFLSIQTAAIEQLYETLSDDGRDNIHGSEKEAALPDDSNAQREREREREIGECAEIEWNGKVD